MELIRVEMILLISRLELLGGGLILLKARLEFLKGCNFFLYHLQIASFFAMTERKDLDGLGLSSPRPSPKEGKLESDELLLHKLNIINIPHLINQV